MLSPLKFQQWYPQYEHLYTAALRNNCTRQLATYLGGTSTIAHGAVVDNAACTLVQDCIWDTQDAHIQLDMSAASVLLGIAPAIISYLGPSLEETSLLFHKQPLLAFLVCIGTPAVHPTPPFAETRPLDRLYDQVGLAVFSPAKPRGSPPIGLIIEHLLAAGAGANIIWLGYDFSFRTVLAWGCNSYFHPLMWTLISILVYSVHAIALHTRIQWIKSETLLTADGIPSMERHTNAPPQSLGGTNANDSNAGSNDCVIWKSKTVAWAILEPLCSIGVVLILTYGTFVFSSSYFVGTIDAITLVARIILSACVTRIIVAIEMSKLRDVVQSDVSRPSGHERSRRS